MYEGVDVNIRPLESLTREELIALIQQEREAVGAGGVSLMSSAKDAEIARLRGTIRALLAERDALREALADLVQGYVNTLESGRDRIVELGGQCDPVDVMEAADTYLRAARAALAQGEA